jgi:hypothetical protein
VLVQNVTDFINGGGKVVVCKVCLGIAGYDEMDTINGTIIATPEITSKVLANATVIDIRLLYGSKKILLLVSHWSWDKEKTFLAHITFCKIQFGNVLITFAWFRNYSFR